MPEQDEPRLMVPDSAQSRRIPSLASGGREPVELPKVPQPLTVRSSLWRNVAIFAGMLAISCVVLLFWGVGRTPLREGRLPQPQLIELKNGRALFENEDVLLNVQVRTAPREPGRLTALELEVQSRSSREALFVQFLDEDARFFDASGRRISVAFRIDDPKRSLRYGESLRVTLPLVGDAAQPSRLIWLPGIWRADKNDSSLRVPVFEAPLELLISPN